MADIDERLEFLLQSTESLHTTVMEHSRQIHELTERAEHNEERWERFNRAMAAALRAWLDGDNSNGGER